MELIFEIGCEELPASFIEPALEQIKEAFLDACDKGRLDAGNLRLVATPRRLTLLVTELSDAQSDLEEVRTGPPAKVGFKEGKPTGAAQGFARGQGVDVEDLYTLETDKGEYVAAKVFEKGLPTQELLPKILTDIIEGLNFPKSMRWAAHSTTFARPVRWIVAVANGQTIPMSFTNIESSNLTYGHRFAAPGAIEVDTIEGYLKDLRDAVVMVEPAERREHIEAFLAEHAEKTGGRIVEDPELVDEVANLIEWPHAVTLDFNEHYLELPREVLISSMRSHQRYFAVEEEDGSALRSACIVIYNTPVRDPKVVAQGNLRVLRARLDDARFFWEKDLKTSLKDQQKELENVIWIGPLGTMRARSERISILASKIAAAMELDKDAQTKAARAGELSKTDLVAHMVDEFPDLQGVMGREYALKAGEKEEVATAIAEQYLPKSADGALPSSDIGAAVAMAEKLDAITGCFGVDMIPTSTSDPYGLRRAALGVLRILHERNSTASLQNLVQLSIEAYPTEPSLFEKSAEKISEQVLGFLITRLHFLLTDHAPTDVVKAVLAAGVEDIPSVFGRIHALDALRDLEDFQPLALGFKRVVNILNKQASEVDLDKLSVNESLFEDPEEQALFEAFQTTQKSVAAHLDARQWDEACRELIKLKAPVDEFFDAVMVMADDKNLRHNRLALLTQLRDLFFEVADISEIQA